MPYKCPWGCTSYNPSCDACEDTIRSDNPYDGDEEEHLNQKAAIHGMTRQEWLDQEDEDNASN